MAKQQSRNLHGDRENLTNKILITISEYNRVLQILEAHRSYSFASCFKLVTLEPSLIHRFWLTKSTSVKSYLQLLENSTKEQERLCSLLFPTKRQFFHNPESWKSLATNAIPKLLTTVSLSKELRCWVINCGTGEEAYTLAMLLNEAISTMFPSLKVKIFANDVNASAIAFAASGIYPKSIAEHISPERLRQYFEPRKEGLAIAPKLRRMIRFASYDIHRDRRPTDINLICCRHTLIYLQPQYRQQLLSKLHDSLTSKGILFLGDNEAIPHTNHEYIPQRGVGKIYQKREFKSALWQKNNSGSIKRYGSNKTLPRLNFQQEVLEVLKFCSGGHSGACFMFSQRYKLLYVYYDTAKLIQLPAPRQNIDSIEFIGSPLKEIFCQALKRVKKEHTSVRYQDFLVNHGDFVYRCDLNIGLINYPQISQANFVVVFLEKSVSSAGASKSRFYDTNLVSAISTLRDIESELERAQTNLLDTVKELQNKQTAIEEINQELVTVNENIQTVNQELYCVNQKYELQVQQLAEINQDLENLLRSIDIGVIFLDRQLNLRKYNSPAQKIINFKNSDLRRPIKDLHHNLDCGNLVEIVEKFIQNQDLKQLEVKNCRTGEFLLMKLHLCDANLEFGQGVILTFVDISDRKQAELALKHKAFYDALTGLPNRLLFKEQLKHAVTRLPRQATQFLAVLYLDLNGFKEVNDSLGHAAGDLLLIEVACRLNEIMRANDIVSRFGGDEFVILLEEIDSLEQSLEIASRIHQVLLKPFAIEHQRIKISTSIGIAVGSGRDNLESKIETLMENADMAMYRAKQKGAAQTEIFIPRMRAQAEVTMEMKNQLGQALQRQEFLLYYQPIFGLKNWELKGFEALLRWNHPELGLIYPQQFLPIIQSSILFPQLERWILERACDRLQQWTQQFQLSQYFSLNVNLSPQLLGHVDFLNYLNEFLEKVGAAARHLTIELTETALIDNARAVEKILVKLRARGVKIALDDFGTGFSSLSHLHHFPLDVIKIDRSFILSLMHNERSSHIVESIIFMSQQLDLTLVAEGIEVLNQLQWLQQHNCQFGQGYFWSPPVSAAATTKFLASATNK
ncbi:EAL domain-containing protein [Myxosarcina sp. GI1]|uniref:EAL domain-containing protein n=1 Tax=Myxosarcina sp. GI1 TaxID=1541065 RepID=UPI00068A8509|nr:EAL domain-containing protein [Myxosarcina sp. GI1]